LTLFGVGLGVDVWVAAVLAATLVVGAAVQGLVGLGLGLVAAPVAALLAPQLMPELLLWMGLMFPLATLVREHHEIDWPGLGWSLPARFPGTAVGVACVAVFSTRALGVAVGTMVLLSVALTVRAVTLPVTRLSLSTAGFLSGVTGTATSIGGPPIAILYQHHPPHQIRSTLAVYFVAGAGLSLTGLAVGGALTGASFVLAVALVPFLLLGLAIARLLVPRVRAEHVRGWVLVVCASSAVVLIVRSVL
jgi:uncharacterized membrane protein YfcA